MQYDRYGNLMLPGLNITDLEIMFNPEYRFPDPAKPAERLTTDPLIKCAGFRTPSLDAASCKNAWEKVPLFGEPGEDVEFRGRYHNPPTSKV